MLPRWIYELAMLPVIYLPLIVAAYGFKPGGGTWKFLAFLFCSIAAVFVLLIFHPAVAILVWIIAWPCTAAARWEVRRTEYQAAVLRSLEKRT